MSTGRTQVRSGPNAWHFVLLDGVRKGPWFADPTDAEIYAKRLLAMVKARSVRAERRAPAASQEAS